MGLTEREDRSLVLRAQAGDADAFAVLVAERRSRLLVLLAATIGDWDEAEDALQEALWRAFTGLRRLREVDVFEAWLRRIVLNVARDHLRAAVARTRREGRPAGSPDDLDALLEAADTVVRGHEAALADREACAAILRSIAALPPLQRRAGRLAWVAGVRLSEVAEILGVSGDSVHTALHRARRRLGEMFYSKGDWRRDVEVVPEGTVRLAGYPDIARIVRRLGETRPDLQMAAVDLHAPADMRLGLRWAEAPGRGSTPPPAAEALPLDRLADAAGFDLEPFGPRLARFTVAGRPYWLPHHDTPHLVLYNADLLQRAGLPVPRSDWTWDEFFGCCRRCAAAGLRPVNSYSPCGWDVALVAEELGATRERLDPVRDAVAFVRDWAREPWAAPDPETDWVLGEFLAGRCVFFMLQFGHSASFFHDPRFQSFPWGVVPVPRFRRSDPPVRYWFHWMVEIHGTAPDPTAAFAVAQAIFTHGPVPEIDDLPAYRTRSAMREWTAQALPLGKECVLELDAATDPLYEPQHFVALPGAIEALQAMVEGELTPEEGIGRMRAGADAYQAGERVAFRD